MSRAARFGSLAGVICAGILLLLTGCGPTGDTGPQGPQGAQGDPGTPGQPISQKADSLNIAITKVSLGATSTVDFKLTDQDGLGYAFLPDGVLEVTVAELIPGTNGDPDHWQNYNNTIEVANGVGPGTQDEVQATTDSGGTLVNHGDGTYTYTMGVDITNVTSPVAVDYDPTLTQRVALAIRWDDGPTVNNNGIYTFQPSTGKTTGIPEDAIVETASCNNCHTELEAHGGPRKDVRMCETCHNKGTTDANSGNTVDFKVMIHKIHDGENLPSVQAGGSYVIYGYRDSAHDFSDVAFPQDVRNCTTCHDPDNPNTPDAIKYAEQPNMAACGACHDDVDFAAGIPGGHPGGVVTDNSSCTVCHADGRVAGSVPQVHMIGTKVAAAKFKYNIISIQNTAPGQSPTITYSITDPTNNDAPYDLSTAPFTSGSNSRIYLDIAWSTTDYTNTDSGSYPALPISIDAVANGTANGDGTYTLTSPTPIPTTATGSGAVGFEGHPAADLDGDGTYTDRIPVTSVVKFFAITDATPTPRREVVDVAKCEKCHGTNDGLAMHGGNRVDNVQLCAVCHNPRNTDLAMRPADPDGTVNGINTAATDGIEQRQIDVKYLIHAIHGAGMRQEDFTVYGFGNSF
ncbi:MAG: OmcA/MtrC family decaheme c-type cytochrome, partial [Gammaproteobacteria bacterium]